MVDETVTAVIDRDCVAGPPPLNMYAVLDQLSVLQSVTQRLETANIPYMITGSIAAGHYAQPRLTRDIDLVVELQSGDAERFSRLFADDFECDPDAIDGAIQRQSMFNLIHTEAIIKVDFVVRKSSPYRVEEFRRRREAIIDGERIWMVAPEDLILSKLFWAKDTRSEVMTDTPPDVQARVDALFARRSGSDRVLMMREMFELGRALVVANIKAQQPAISERELRVRLFERLYGDELSPEIRARFIRRLSGDTRESA